MGDIFQEVEEDLRRDRLNKLWAVYGKYAIGAAVAIVLGTSASVGWREYTTTRQEAYSDRLTAALALAKENKAQEATAALATLAGDAASGYATVARLREALIHAENKAPERAAEVYDALAADTDIDPLYRDLSALLSVTLQIDTGDTEALQQKLTLLMAEEAPFRHLARELTAALSLRGGNREQARGELDSIVADPTAPDGIKSRAADILQALGKT